ncbi:MAG: hydrogenase maturation protease [Alphaproteobacteria bacterium]|nr:hydrogenase maturation protease [Alphaproteobacteria bacterium]MCB9929694.1 hydrogenase maturation protease [Alphaproteobacteria bacterium]
MSVLVIGIGNPDRGDDGAGPLVVSRLGKAGVPGLALRSSGGDPADLLAAWEGKAAVVLVDACASGSEPGTIHRFDAVDRPLPETFGAVSTHGFGLGAAVELARAMDALPPALRVYGIEAAGFAPGAPLSPAVEAAAEAVADEIARLFGSGPCTKPA